MSDENEVQYPLKPIDGMLERDVDYPQYSLEVLHEALSSAQLSEQVPLKVRQLIESAKNLVLYSYYAYMFNQAAEMTGFIAFEMALRIKAQEESPEMFWNKKKEKEVVPTLHDLINKAVDLGWIAENKFEDSSDRARRNLESQYRYEILRSGICAGDFTLLGPTEEEIEEEVQGMDFVSGMLHAGRSIRNGIAHGKSGFGPEGLSSVVQHIKLINQLFS